MKILKGQISIEFMIVFAFILVVFLFLFALITQQRAITQNSQTFSQLQLVAQTIALQINRASQAGSGFSAQLPITTSIGNIPYNVSVTKAGVVIIAATSGTQIMRATAYSNVQSVSSSSSFYGLGNTLYVLPIANGTISLQNSFGTICIDYQCPTNANVSGSVSLSSQVVQAAMFNGAVGGSQLTGANANSILSNTAPGFSISAWVYPTNSITSRGVTQGNSYVMRIDSPGEGSKLSWFMYIANSIEPRLSSTNPLKINNWYHVVGTYNSSTGYMGLYINGVLNSSETRAGAATLGYCACFNIGVGSSSDWAGGIANFQMYNVGLSANQVKALYSNGIAGSPINSTYLKGWWPLGGNANDYSGNGENLTSGTVLYTTAAQLFASVKNPLGQAVNNMLIGFATTLGNFSNGAGSAQAQASYSNSKGVASLFLNQQGNNGQALVKATALNSNTLPQSLLTTWYPLNLGQGSLVHDVSGNLDNGAFGGQPSWNAPNYGGNFDGQTGYITAGGLSYNTFTISVWVKLNALQNGRQGMIETGNPINQNHLLMIEQTNNCNNAGVTNTGFMFKGRFWSQSTGYVTVCDPITPITNMWYLLTTTYDGSNLDLYVNGVLTANLISTSVAGPSNREFIGACLVCNYYFNGSIANLQFYNLGLTQNQVSQIYSGGISANPLTSNLVGWWPLNGDANDYGPSANNGIIYGGVSFTPLSQTLLPSQSSNGNSGKILSASFNGVSSFIKVGNITKINSLSNWSISFWMNSTSTANYKNPLDANFVPGSNNAGPRFEQGGGGGTNSLNLIVGPGGPSYNAFIYSNTIIPNVWYNVIASRNGNTIAGYLNGVMVFNGVQGLGFPSGFANLTIGRGYANSVDRWFSGNIMGVQVYNQTLSSQQALKLYQEGITGVPLPSTKLAAWLPLNGNANNYSISSGINSLQVTNVPFNNVINYVPYLLQANNYSGIYFNGQNSYVQANYILSYDRNVPFSIAFWMNTKVTGQDGFLIGDANGLGAVSAGFEAWLWHGAKCVIWRFEDTSGNVYGPGCTTNVEDGNWHYVVVTFDGSSNQAGMKLYVDGKLDGTAGSLAISAPINPYPSQYNSFLALGAGNINHNYLYTGSLSNVQVFSAALTLAQVQQLYNTQPAPSSSIVVPLSWSP